MAKKVTKPKPLSQQVREAIKASKISRYRIWKEKKIDQGTLSRFMAGEGGLSQEALDAIGELLELEIVMPNPPPPPSVRGKSTKGR